MIRRSITAEVPEWLGADLRAWRKRHRLTVDRAGALIGVSRHFLNRQASPRRIEPVKRMLVLACLALDTLIIERPID